MRFGYNCSKCSKSEWSVSYDSELCDHLLVCLKCKDVVELKSLSRTLKMLQRPRPKPIVAPATPKPVVD